VLQKSKYQQYVYSNDKNNRYQKNDHVSNKQGKALHITTQASASNSTNHTSESIRTNLNNNETSQAYEYSRYNATEYAIQLQQSTKPLDIHGPVPSSNNNNSITTCAYLHSFWSGFCNEYYMFTGVILMATHSNHSQIILHSIKWKDLFGTNHQIRHDVFFDVVHWNTYYPILPKFVSHDKHLHHQLIINDVQHTQPKLTWNISNPYENATNPYAIGKGRNDAIMTFYEYTKHIQKGWSNRSEIELLMMKEAFQPHPAIKQIIYDFKSKHQMKDILVWHARIEPDMQKHPMCKNDKVLNISDVVEMIYDKYVDPPPEISTVLIVLNRDILEREVSNSNTNKAEDKNEMAMYNLNALNEIVSKGLWGGRVKVVEAGSNLAKESEYELYSKYNSLTGSIINFFLALEAKIFVGAKVSSWSTSVISYRFFREQKENYFYLPKPKGLESITPPSVKQPPRFAC